MIGFYVHHHGRGHLGRTEAVLPHLSGPSTVLTSLDTSGAALGDAAVVTLPLDVDEDAPPAPTAYLHYAPVGSAGLLRRSAQIAAWAERERPSLLVVDVSVEVALLGRLLGLPVVVSRQHGRRTDPAHLAGYDAAVSLLAPFPAELEDPATPAWVVERTCYAGMLSRFDGRVLDRDSACRAAGLDPGRRHVVVLDGAGGAAASARAVADAAAATPEWTWTLLGAGGAGGWVPDPFPVLRAADVVVASAGTNSVAEAMAADRPLVCIPQDRPFDEQRAKATLLARSGAAVVAGAWPAPEEWPSLLAAAGRLDPAVRSRMLDGKGARRAAEHLEDVAARYSRRSAR